MLRWDYDAGMGLFSSIFGEYSRQRERKNAAAGNGSDLTRREFLELSTAVAATALIPQPPQEQSGFTFPEGLFYSGVSPRNIQESLRRSFLHKPSWLKLITETPGVELGACIEKRVPMGAQGWNECGVKSLDYVMRHYNMKPNYSGVMNALRRVWGGFDPSTTRNPVGLSPMAIAEVAQNTYKMGVPKAHDGWTLDEYISAIGAGNPVILDLNADFPYNLGHLVVGVGISKDGKFLVCEDSLYGQTERVLYPVEKWLNSCVDVYDPRQKEGHVACGIQLTPPDPNIQFQASASAASNCSGNCMMSAVDRRLP